MKHEFQILLDGKLITYDNYHDIPASFDNLIVFKPVIPDGPHTHEQHEAIGVWNIKLQELMKRETK